MTENNAAQPGLTDDEINDLCGWRASNTTMRAENDRALARAVESALLSKLRAEGVQAGDERETFLAWANKEYGITEGYELNESQRDVLENKKGWMARAALASAPVAEPEWIDDPHDIEQGMMRNPKYVAPVAGEAQPVAGSRKTCWRACATKVATPGCTGARPAMSRSLTKCRSMPRPRPARRCASSNWKRPASHMPASSRPMKMAIPTWAASTRTSASSNPRSPPCPRNRERRRNGRHLMRSVPPRMRLAVALLGLPRRTEPAAATTAAMRINDHGAIRRVNGTASQQTGHDGQATEDFHMKDSGLKMRAVYCPSLKQGQSGGYRLYVSLPWSGAALSAQLGTQKEQSDEA